MDLLRATRPDLAGLPFVMGDACRLGKEEGKRLGDAVAMFHDGTVRRTRVKTTDWREEVTVEYSLWDSWGKKYPPAQATEPQRQGEYRAALAAMSQLLPVQPAALRVGAMPHLAARPDAAAGEALARLVLFDADEGVRQAALKALEKRSPREATDVLLHGLRYPWPQIAR